MMLARRHCDLSHRLLRTFEDAIELELGIDVLLLYLLTARLLAVKLLVQEATAIDTNERT